MDFVTMRSTFVLDGNQNIDKEWICNTKAYRVINYQKISDQYIVVEYTDEDIDDPNADLIVVCVVQSSKQYELMTKHIWKNQIWKIIPDSLTSLFDVLTKPKFKTQGIH